MNRLYIDVTESYAWQGKVTGIIRVMDEIAGRFFEDTALDATFVIWNEDAKAFVQIDYAEILDKRSADKSEANVGVVEEGVVWKVKNGILKLPYAAATYRKLKARKQTAIRGITFEKEATLFMPHGGTWGSKHYARYVIGLKRDTGIKIIPLLYDLCPVVVPQYCFTGTRKIFNRHMRTLLPEADLILAISKNTAQDAQKWLGEIAPKAKPAIKTFRLGDEIGQQESAKPKVDLPEKFIVCVGTIEARKNHMNLYFAYKLAAEQKVDLPAVVVVGRNGWLADDIYEMLTIDPDTKDKFIFIHNADDYELRWLYENALFSVYPSFYEGWGLPVAESLLRGVPCIASKVSSIPEIAGDLIDYFSPYSAEEIMTKIAELWNDPKLVEAKAKHIRANYKATKWDDSYYQVRAIINTV